MKSQVWRISGWSQPEMSASVSALRVAIDAGKAYTLIGGHVQNGIHQEPGIPESQARSIALVRNPIDRIVSLYIFIRRQEKHELYNWTKTVTFSEVIRDPVLLPRISKVQWTQVLGARPSTTLIPRWPDIERRVLQGRLLLGASERYADFVATLNRHLPFVLEPTRYDNAAPGGSLVSLSEADLQWLDKLNEQDSHLWSHAIELSWR